MKEEEEEEKKEEWNVCLLKPDRLAAPVFDKKIPIDVNGSINMATKGSSVSKGNSVSNQRSGNI